MGAYHKNKAMMKKFLLSILIGLMVTGCRTDKKADTGNQKPVITVSILPQKTFVEKIAGDDFKINVLIPPGASPASYTLLPSQLTDIAHSILWFRIGHIGFEHSWKEKIAQANRQMKVVDLSEGLNLIAATTGIVQNPVQTEGVDPHIWLSPQMVKKMAAKIRNILTGIYPERATFYTERYTRFMKEIDTLDIELRKILRDSEGKTVLVFHPSLTYFARDYHLHQISLEPGGKEPTPQHIKKVVDIANQKNIQSIMIQSELDKEHARIFAEEINGEIIQVSPLDPEWAANLIHIATIIKDRF
jgi:zinc transport system substrate-binding protein